MFGAARILGSQEIDDPVNVMDFARAAQKKLDPVAWDYLEGGAVDEATLRDNIDGFKKIIIRPKALTGVGTIDTSLELFGVKLDYPIMLDPTGGKTCFWPNGEIVTGEAAARAKAVYVSAGISELTKGGKGPANFYLTTILGSTQLKKTLVRRAEDQGASAIVFTIDIFYYPHKDRNFRNNFDRGWCGPGVPPRDALGRLPKPVNPERLHVGNWQLDAEHARTPTWEDVKELVSLTKLPVIIKAVLTKEAAQQAVAAGAKGVIVSNHGGRQLDQAGGTIEALPEVVEGAAGRIPVMIDGGIRRGTDVIKALALGAKAVLIGRPYCYGLAAFGGPGVERVLAIWRSELVNNMGHAGVGSLREIDRSLVRIRG
jgi:isopentenyl diphosphate isomerase/L-lactate dehydrogenase-like FMN-dependent dehydrogenase